MSNGFDDNPDEIVGLPTLPDLIPPERIALGVEAVDWRDATRIAGRLLLDTGAIREPYIEAMLRTAEELGPYIVIAPGIAMPHARPEEGAIQTALSLVRLNTPINFGHADHDPVTLIFALAALDKQIHLRAMQTLATLLLSKDLVRRLMVVQTKEEVYSLFAQAEQEED